MWILGLKRLISPDATILVLLSVSTLIETIFPKICSKSRLKSAKSLLPADMHRSGMSLLKLPNFRPVSQFPFHVGVIPFALKFQ